MNSNSSVQLQNLCFTHSYNKNYDGCADVVSTKNHFSFQLAWELSEYQWCLDFRRQTVPC